MGGEYRMSTYDELSNPNKYLPHLIIFFAVLGWVLATGTNKTQVVRLVDIFVYGPYLTYLAFQEDYVFSTIEKLFLAFLGTTTISYNARNYLKM